MKATRDGFGEGLLELGRTNGSVVVLVGDLAGSTRSEWFGKEFPERFFNMGISEQDMLGTACGLSIGGKIPFVCSFSCFGCSRGYDQIRISVCYNNLNVKVGGTHSGITVGADGATAQALEDIAGMRALPNMTVIIPADAVEAKKATIKAADRPGPVYLRLGRPPVPIITKEEDPFEIGKANLLWNGDDVSIFACGIMVNEALQASSDLEKEGIKVRVVNLHTVKPIDEEAILAAAKETGAIVTAEEHHVHGGFGSAVSEVVVRNCPVPMEMVGIGNIFGESGQPQELMEKYGISKQFIVAAVKRVLRRK